MLYSLNTFKSADSFLGFRNSFLGIIEKSLSCNAALTWNSNTNFILKLYELRYWTESNGALGLNAYYDQVLKEKYISLSLIDKLPLHVGNAWSHCPLLHFAWEEPHNKRSPKHSNSTTESWPKTLPMVCPFSGWPGSEQDAVKHENESEYENTITFRWKRTRINLTDLD